MLQPAPRYKWPAIAGHGGPQNAGLLPAARASNMCQRLGAAGAAEGHGGRECSDAMPFDAWIDCDIYIYWQKHNGAPTTDPNIATRAKMP